MAAGCDPPDRPCILIVDDDPDLLAMLFTELVEEGFSIVAASHGQQALDLLERGLRPHVILIDLMLPRVTGVDVLTHIRADPELRTIPRIVMTGSSQRVGIVADAVFAKPFDHDELLRAIHRLIVPRTSTDGAGTGRASADDRSPSRNHARSADRRQAR
jgi:CheY-like chemotaxis protein